MSEQLGSVAEQIVEPDPEQMCQIIQDAAVEMGQHAKRDDTTGILIHSATMMMRVAACWEADKHGFPHILLRAAFSTAVAWMEATSATLVDEIMGD